MPITEIALLHLSSGATIDDASLRSKLTHAKTVMQNYTGRSFSYLQQVEDPTYIYIIGEWDSLDQHMNEFIPGADNQALLESLKDLLSVDWLLHIDAAHAQLPLPGADGAKQEAPVYAIGRHWVKDGQKEQFQQTFETEKHHLQGFLTEGDLGGGWRIDKEENKEEWVLMTPWDSVEQHFAFAKTDGFAQYSKITGYIEGAEIKHARLLDT
ncbi:hypothetical protein E8E13_006416 [Curvularia kusanoi]|uniref:ABM domain-containing protein n=1 Tax=Curvularia kusanoi TaxID=90978 RepID=A0A9P4W9Z3_CURKU|nr:hypothetical protein E8E13_006416 [Curvularia kusanoi]